MCSRQTLEEEARCAQLLALLRAHEHLAVALFDAMTAAAEAGVLPPAGGEDACAAATLLEGFGGSVLPFLSADALALPKLCACFFDALSAVLALARAPGAPPLSEELARAARHSLRHGARHRAEVSRVALEAVYALGAHAAQQEHAPEPVCALVAALQHELLLDLAGSQIHPDSADVAGNALLALVVARPDAWAALVEGIAAGAAEPEALRQLFAQLTSANGVRGSLDRPNRARFRANLALFLAAVRQRPHLAAILRTAEQGAAGAL